MKRGIAALVIFLLCIAFSVFCTFRNKQVLEHTQELLENVKYSCKSDEPDKAKTNSYILKEEWKKHRLIIETTLDKKAVKEIENTVISLPVLLNDGNTDTAYEKCSDALCEIAYLLEKEKITFENVF